MAALHQHSHHARTYTFPHTHRAGSVCIAGGTVKKSAEGKVCGAAKSAPAIQLCALQETTTEVTASEFGMPTFNTDSLTAFMHTNKTRQSYKYTHAHTSLQTFMYDEYVNKHSSMLRIVVISPMFDSAEDHWRHKLQKSAVQVTSVHVLQGKN